MRFVLTIGLALLALPAHAVTFCPEPVAPFCVGQEATYESDLVLQRCQQDLKTYVDNMTEYAQCLQKQSEEALAARQEILDYFECRERGDPDCGEPPQ